MAIALLILARVPVADDPFGSESLVFREGGTVGYDGPTIVRAGRSLVVSAVEITLRGQAVLYNLVTIRSDDRGASWKDFTRVLPEVGPDTPRSVLGPRLASRSEAMLIGWTEWLENPDGGRPAYATRASVSEDAGLCYTSQVEISAPTAFGAGAHLAAVGVTSEGFVAVVSRTDDFTGYTVSAYEASPPYDAWEQTFMFPDSSVTLVSVDIVNGADGTYVAIGTDTGVAVHRRDDRTTWSRVAYPETGSRAHDAQLATRGDGLTAIAWTDRQLPALAYVRTTPDLLGGEWSPIETFTAPQPEDYVLSKLATTSDGTFHILLHRTPDRFTGTYDLIHFCSTDGETWIEAAEPLNAASRRARRGRGAEIVGGEAVAVVWEDDHSVSSAGVRFRTTADRPPVALEPSPLPLVSVPNPMTSAGRIAFRSPVDGSATLRLFGLGGVQLGSWRIGAVEPATYYFDWDTRAENGRRVDPGVYFWRVEVATADTVMTGSARSVVVR